MKGVIFCVTRLIVCKLYECHGVCGLKQQVSLIPLGNHEVARILYMSMQSVHRVKMLSEMA